jgi:hypothetical protein
MGFHQKPLRQGAKCSQIHGRLDVSDGMRRKRGDAVGQSLDKGRQLVRWQRSIDIAVTFCQFCGEIIATEKHLQGASYVKQAGRLRRCKIFSIFFDRERQNTRDRNAQIVSAFIASRSAPSAAIPKIFRSGGAGRKKLEVAETEIRPRRIRMRIFCILAEMASACALISELSRWPVTPKNSNRTNVNQPVAQGNPPCTKLIRCLACLSGVVAGKLQAV